MNEADVVRARAADRSADVPSAEALHHLVERVSPDPLPDSGALDAPDRTWVYRRTDYELATLGRLVSDGFASNRYVHYAENYGRPAETVEFRCDLDGDVGDVVLVSPGVLTAWLDGCVAATTSTADGPELRIRAGSAARVAVLVAAADGEPATVAVLGPSQLVGHQWTARKVGGGTWESTLPRAGSATPPHLAPHPTIAIPVDDSGDLRALPAPIIGRVAIRASARPSLRTGESPREALAPEDTSESSHGLVETSDGWWESEHELGMAYLRVSDGENAEVRVSARVPSIARRGAFACSDDRLTRIWAASAYTLRLCMQGLFVDGIKRDRMPWAGDHSLSTLANAFAFGQRDVSRDSITALGQPTHGYVNGISDYSLWWLINAEIYTQHFGDLEHVSREADSIHHFVLRLAEHADDAGLFHPADQADGFEDASAGSVFIDWGVSVEPDRIYVPLQLLYYWALISAGRLLDRARHPGAARWLAEAAVLASTLRERAWSADGHAWREYLDGPVSDAPHAHFLGVLSGLTPEEMYSHAAERLAGHTRAGTPFMTSFLLRALAVVGHPDAVVRRVQELWGAMLDAGATTFWEEFADESDDPYEMYGRPFGKSLCHAWSAGPAAVLPETILGLHPLTDGWKTFAVEPALGDLEWAGAIVPTGFGDLVVRADRGHTRITIPPGTSAVVAGAVYSGPAEVDLPARD